MLNATSHLIFWFSDNIASVFKHICFYEVRYNLDQNFKVLETQKIFLETVLVSLTSKYHVVIIVSIRAK